MVIPCLCFFTNGSDLHCSCPVPTNRGGANGAPAGGAFLVDIPTEAVAEVRGLDELRLLIFPQPLGGALKNQNAAPASPPCFRRRRRSAPLLFSSCPAHAKNPESFDSGFLWWSIVSSSRTFRQAYRCCGQSASNRETEALRNASALARVLFSVDIRAGQCCPADHADFGKLHSNQRRTVCRLR